MVAIRVIRIQSLGALTRELEALSLGDVGQDYVFRGHRDSTWRLTSTFSRFSTTRLPELRSMAFEHLVSRFMHGLATIGHREMVNMSRRGRLEFARHHGVPSPLIDFTRSPFIALWFAFDGVRGSVDKASEAAVYALNWNYLGVAYGLLCDQKGWSNWLRREYGRPPMDVFRWELPTYFNEGYPQPALKFIPFAASWNTKVQRQMGCFIYETLDYNNLGVKDLEAFIDEHDAAVRVGRKYPILIKFIIPCAMAREVFDYLDMIGINGARLMDDYTGVAADVRNTFNYNPRYHAWDLIEDKDN